MASIIFLKILKSSHIEISFFLVIGLILFLFYFGVDYVQFVRVVFVYVSFPMRATMDLCLGRGRPSPSRSL